MSRPRRRRPTTARVAQPAAPAPAAKAPAQARRSPGRAAPAPPRPRGLDPAARETLTTPPPPVVPTDAADAVVRSLGAPPLPGHEVMAEHYFAAVYERSVALATALASAAGLLAPPTDD